MPPRGRLRARVVATAFTLLTLAPTAAWAATEHVGLADPERAPLDAEGAMRDGKVSFCKNPPEKLSARARRLCPAAGEIPGCEAFAKACAAPAPPATPGGASSPRRSSPELRAPSALGAAAQVLVWLLVAAAIVAIAIPVIRAILKARADKKVADAPSPKAAAAAAEAPAPVVPATSDAELLLRAAEDHARRGDFASALQLYLAAALRALDKRGVVRLAKDRTNGEYVRGCRDDAAKAPLREIVREVDLVQFGGVPPTADAVGRAAQRAVALVRAAPAALLAIALLLAGCSGGGGGARGPSAGRDPAGDELAMEVISRQGLKVSRLSGALASLPLPKAGAKAPAVIVDTDETKLDDDTAAHLLTWVEAGGALLLAGDPDAWPAELKAKELVSHARDEKVAVKRPESEIPEAAPSRPTTRRPARPRRWDDDDDDDEPPPRVAPRPLSSPTLPAKVEIRRALDWKGPEGTSPKALAWYDPSYAVYAATLDKGKGRIVGVASDELLTNAAVARGKNAAALVALVAATERDEVLFARPEDGIAPPSNPLSGMQRAGLGLGLWHALAAAVILFLAVGIRLARPRPAPPPTRRAFTEHVEATGALYARTGVASHALAAYAKFADERLRARMPRGMTDVPAFLAARTGANAATCERLWNRARGTRPTDSPRGDELEVLKELSALTAQALAS